MKRLLLTATLALGLSAPAAQAQQQPVKITLGYTLVIDYLGAFVAKEEGFFSKRGLDVTIQQMPNGNSIPPGLLSDSLQIGAITAPTLIQSKTASFPMKIVAGASVVTKDNPNGSIVVRKGVEVKEPKDFEGKRIAVGAVGSYFNVLFRQWLINNGVDPNKPTYVEAQFSQMADVMSNGQVDAATMGQPFLSRVTSAGIGTEYLPFTGTFGNGLLSNIYTATDQWIAKNPAAPKAFLEAIEEANAFIKSNPDKAREHAVKYLKLPAEAMTNLPFSNYSAKVEPQQIKAWSDIMLGQKLIDTSLDPNSVLIQ
jgi:NitT/TauT family transport system substrate-binding protein